MFRLREVLEAIPEADRPSLYQLARETGLSYTTVHGIHSNRATRVDLATLGILAARLGLKSPGELIGEGKAPAKRKRGRG